MNKKPFELKREAAHIVPSMNIGKSGITDPLILELRNQLKRNRLVKVKILKTAVDEMDRNDIAKELSMRTGSLLVEVKGNSAVLYLK